MGRFESVWWGLVAGGGCLGSMAGGCWCVLICLGWCCVCRRSDVFSFLECRWLWLFVQGLRQGQMVVAGGWGYSGGGQGFGCGRGGGFHAGSMGGMKG